MKNFTVAIHSLGNIGRCAIEAALSAPDCACLGVLRRRESLGTCPNALHGLIDFPDIESLIKAHGRPDVVILCGPSRKIPEMAADYLEKGFATVDSFDAHSEIACLVEKLDIHAKNGKVASITAAGWDPGSDSVVRALFEAMAPIGTTFTNFGRGRSMGHTVAAKAICGVRDAISITIPMGGGRHSRLVYVVPESGETYDSLYPRIKADAYFSGDDLDLRLCDNVQALGLVADQSHGVLMERTGASGMSHNQTLKFDMQINNPALTAQILLSCARATTRLDAGCYTLIDVPMVKLLPGDRMNHIRRLV